MYKTYIGSIAPYLLIASTFSPFISFALRNYVDMSYIFTINILMIVAFVGILFTRAAPYKYPLYAKLFLCFCIYTILSDVFIANKPIGIRYFYLNVYVGTAIMLFYVENGFFDRIGKKYLLINEIILVIAVVVILFQQFVNNSFFVYDGYVKSYYSFGTAMEARLPAIFSYYGGSVSVGFAFIPVFAFILAEKLKNNKGITSVILLLGMGAIFAFLTKYRWIMLNYLIVCFMIFKYKNYYARKGVSLVFALVFVVLFSLILVQSYDVPIIDIINDRILEKGRGGITQGTASTRLLAIEIFQKLFPDNPILGRGMLHGFGEEGSGDMKLLRAIGGKTSQIHVGYLSLFYYYGIVGGVIYLTFLGSIITKLYKDSKYHSNWGIYFGFLGFVIANFTLVTFNLLYPGVVLLLIYNRYFITRRDEELKGE